MRTAILTALFGTFALTAAAQSQAYDDNADGYPGGYVLLISNTPGQRQTEIRQHVDINKLKVVDPPSSTIPTITSIKFSYFLNIDEDKVVCHPFSDVDGLVPVGRPFTKAVPVELKLKKKTIQVRSILCIVKGGW